MILTLLMFVVGCVVGVMTGALGIGGAIAMIPAMHIFVPGMDPHTAKGTTLFVIVFVAAINAFWQNRPWRKAPWSTIFLMGLAAAAGSYSGAWLTDMWSGRTVTSIFLGAIFLIYVRLVVSREPRERLEVSPGPRIGIKLAVGTFTGLVGGMTGIGGGLILVPLALLTGLSTNKHVTGLSNMVMVLTGLAAVTVHIRAQQFATMPGTIGQVNLLIAGAIFAGAQLGSPVGRWLNLRLTYRQRTRALLAVLVMVMIRMTYEILNT